MRVIAGTCKGRKLVAPKSSDVRPALDQVKEAIFNILFDVTDMTVLDLFAGSGSVGIEALSRGARHATFVDRHPAAHDALAKNITACGFESRTTLLKMSVAKAIPVLGRKDGRFDLIFVDPPYLKNFVNDTLTLLGQSKLIHDDSIIVIEHHPKEPIASVLGMTLTDTRKYGQTLISFMKKE